MTKTSRPHNNYMINKDKLHDLPITEKSCFLSIYSYQSINRGESKRLQSIIDIMEYSEYGTINFTILLYLVIKDQHSLYTLLEHNIED